MTAESAPLLARDLGRFVASMDADQIPATAYERARLHVLDALGTGLAAVNSDFTEVTARALTAMGDGGESLLIGRRDRLPLRDALLLNGVLIHGLDFDDTHGPSVTHCSASAVPLVLGVGEKTGATGREVLAAYLLAVEVDARLGAVARGTLQKRGWHPTGVIGAFGCAAAAGRLLGAGPQALADAFGITLSMASGNLEFLADGAWTKRLHPGWAAVAGYTAAQLGLAGYVGPTRPFEGRFGLFRMLLAELPAMDSVLANLGSAWAIDENGFKPYPACHFLHAFIDCALRCHGMEGFHVDDIEHIEALIHPDEVDIVCEPLASKLAPRSAYDAQFSLYYAVAASLRKGCFGLDELDPEALADAQTLALARRVSWQADSESRYPTSYSGALRITLKNGRVLEERQPVNRGSAENPLEPTEVISKFRRNALRSQPPARVQAIEDAVMNLEAAPDLAALRRALVPA